MRVDVFQIVLWGVTGLLVIALCAYWWRKDVVERRRSELAQRWRKATLWTPDTSARVVRLSRLDAGTAWLEHDGGELQVELPDDLPEALDAGWYLHVSGWTSASRAAAKGKRVSLSAEKVLDAFPPHTPALNDRLVGRGERRPGIVSRLLGFRGL